MAPLAHAVGLVDHKPRDEVLLVQADEQPNHALGVSVLLRGDVQELARAVGFQPVELAHEVAGPTVAVVLLLAVYVAGAHADAVHGVDLVLDERDQGREDNRQSRAAPGRELVAQGLASAGWHEDEAVPALHGESYDRLLP
eukprot:8821726-Prorocentrum_lima.AAC.1